MRLVKSFLLLSLLCLFGASSAHAPAQVSVGVNIGPEPYCPYGYFDYAPYDCAPYGYYGPDWFNGGIFIGAGPWFHGHHGFYGHVDNRYDPHNGYRGPLPERGEHPFNGFRGNEARDGGGHVGHANHDAGGEHSPGFSGHGGAGGRGHR
jgi:hypothetical protein